LTSLNSQVTGQLAAAVAQLAGARATAAAAAVAAAQRAARRLRPRTPATPRPRSRRTRRILQRRVVPAHRDDAGHPDAGGPVDRRGGSLAQLLPAVRRSGRVRGDYGAVSPMGSTWAPSSSASRRGTRRPRPPACPAWSVCRRTLPPNPTRTPSRWHSSRSTASSRGWETAVARRRPGGVRPDAGAARQATKWSVPRGDGHDPVDRLFAEEVGHCGGRPPAAEHRTWIDAVSRWSPGGDTGRTRGQHPQDQTGGWTPPVRGPTGFLRTGEPERHR